MDLFVDWTQVRKEPELNDISIEITKTERQREQRQKNKIFKDSVSTPKGVTYL